MNSFKLNLEIEGLNFLSVLLSVVVLLSLRETFKQYTLAAILTSAFFPKHGCYKHCENIDFTLLKELGISSGSLDTTLFKGAYELFTGREPT